MYRERLANYCHSRQPRREPDDEDVSWLFVNGDDDDDEVESSQRHRPQ